MMLKSVRENRPKIYWSSKTKEDHHEKNEKYHKYAMTLGIIPSK